MIYREAEAMSQELVAEEVSGDRLDAAAQFFVEALFDQLVTRQ